MFVTDQSNDIAHTIKLASQSRLAKKKRPVARKNSITDSLRKSLKSSDTLLDVICDTENMYGCEDSVISKINEKSDEHDTFPRFKSKIERCMSCISKLGALSMSRSSTTTATPGVESEPNWQNIETQRKPLPSFNTCHQLSRLDSISMDSHPSSASSEYSIPRLLNIHPKSSASPLTCFSPVQPQKMRNETKFSTDPYDNYDVPKSPFLIESENYDRPKNLSRVTSPEVYFGNYDQPLSNITQCVCNTLPTKTTQLDQFGSITDCTCHRVMSWADKWITLPYCRRGNSIENTNVPINRFRLSGEGKMPVVHIPGELPEYATIDMAKKIFRRLNIDENKYKSNDNCNLSQKITCQAQIEGSSNILSETLVDKTQLNYINLEFEKSLPYYENSKDVMIKAQSSCVLDKINELITSDMCSKCGHNSTFKNSKKSVSICEGKNIECVCVDYMVMEPGKRPINNENPCNTLPLPLKGSVFRQILENKSSSNPSLTAPIVDRSRKMLIQSKISCSAESFLNEENVIEKDNELDDDNENNVNDEIIKCDNDEKKDNTNECDNEYYTVKASSIVSSETDEASSKSYQKKYMRRSASVPFRTYNRDSSSSYDSGVSTGSLQRNHRSDFNDLELPASNSISVLKYKQFVLPSRQFTHCSLPRRSKSSDPLKEISFQFQNSKIPEKSSSAEAEVPIDSSKFQGYELISTGQSITDQPTIDSRSTSSRTSDMSDIETLSLSSHSSSDIHDGMR